MDYWLWIGLNIVFIMFCAILLLLPFHTKEKQINSRKRTLKNRFGALFVLNNIIFMTILGTLWRFIDHFLISIIISLIYYVLAAFILLYPNFLQRKHLDKYKGIWKDIGDWLGDPREVFPTKKGS